VSTLVYFKDIPGLQGKFDAIAFENLQTGPPAIFSRIKRIPRMAGFYVSIQTRDPQAVF